MLALLFAALAAALAVPASAQTSAAPAAPAAFAPSVPLLYRVQLGRGDADAAIRFLEDGPAQQWFKLNRPADLALLLETAHAMCDLRDVSGYAADPAALRRALLARSYSRLFDEPGALLSAVERDPLLAATAPTYARAALEWDSLTDDERYALTAVLDPGDAAHWPAVPLPARAQLLRQAFQAVLWVKSQGRRFGDPLYLAALDDFHAHAGEFLSKDEELALRMQRSLLESHQRRLAEARARIEALADPELAGALKRIEGALDLDAAANALAGLFDAMNPAPAQPDAALPESMSPELLAAVSARLPRMMRRLARGTEAGAMLVELDSGKAKTAVEFGDFILAGAAAYDCLSDRIQFKTSQLRDFLAWEGRPAADLLGDLALLQRFALLVLPEYVHEATHRRQHLALALQHPSNVMPQYLHSQSNEEEAYMAQALVARRLITRPELKAFFSDAGRLRAVWSVAGAWGMAAESPERIKAFVRGRYEDVPGEFFSRALAVSFARMDAKRLAPSRPAMLAELARRRRLPALERAALARGPRPAGEDSSFRSWPTRVLRQMVRLSDLASHEGLYVYYGYLDGLARARKALSDALSKDMLAARQ